MRHYRYEATDETVEALRLLRRAWQGFRHDEEGLTIRLADGPAVRIAVQRAEVDEALEAFRLRASVVDAPRDLDGAAGDAGAASELGLGGNDVVLFAGATWAGGPGAEVGGEVGSEVGSEASTVQFSGHPGQIPEDAEVVVITTDALVVASSVGTGMLVRLGLKPMSLDVVEDAEEIARFVTARGYTAG